MNSHFFRTLCDTTAVAHHDMCNVMLCLAALFLLCCTVLYCTVLYCTVLYCTVLYCTVLCLLSGLLLHLFHIQSSFLALVVSIYSIAVASILLLLILPVLYRECTSKKFPFFLHNYFSLNNFMFLCTEFQFLCQTVFFYVPL